MQLSWYSTAMQLSWYRDGNLSTVTHCDADAVEYEQSLSWYNIFIDLDL